MNERGNITIALALVLIVLGFISVLTWTILSSSGVATREVKRIETVYTKDSAIETVKYITTNKLALITYQSFDETTQLLSNQELATMQQDINNALTQLNNDLVMVVETKEQDLLSNVCDKLYTTDLEGVQVFTGMYCDYVPVSITLQVTIKQDGKPAGAIDLKYTDMYLYEQNGIIDIDITNLKLTVE